MLCDRHYEVYIVDAGPGVDFGKLVNGYLHKIKQKQGVLLAVCTETYGEKTASQYSTFEELTYADSWGLQVVPLKMTDVYPPRPQHEAAKELSTRCSSRPSPGWTASKSRTSGSPTRLQRFSDSDGEHPGVQDRAGAVEGSPVNTLAAAAASMDRLPSVVAKPPRSTSCAKELVS